MNLKEEIKKSTASEIVKTVIRLVLFLALMLGAALIPSVRDRIWPATPKVLLLVLLVASASANLLLVPLVLHLRRKHKALKTEMESKPIYPYKFGVKWDEDFNPHCPHCEAYLSAYQYVPMSTMPDISRFFCAGCGRTILMTDGAQSIHFNDAKAIAEGSVIVVDPPE